jgi:outer membrane protein OmpA-like peptidoglycan-associated protein
MGKSTFLLLNAFLFTTLLCSNAFAETQKIPQPAKGNTMIVLSGGVVFETKQGGLVDSIYSFMNSGSPADFGSREFPLQGINFESGTAAISKDSNTTLDQLASVFKAFPTTPVKLEGQAEGKVSGAQRAEALKAALVSRGVAAAQVTALTTAAADKDAKNWSVKATITRTKS